jgi:hypothetical protein
MRPFGLIRSRRPTPTAPLWLYFVATALTPGEESPMPTINKEQKITGRRRNPRRKKNPGFFLRTLSILDFQFAIF